MVSTGFVLPIFGFRMAEAFVCGPSGQRGLAGVLATVPVFVTMQVLGTTPLWPVRSKDHRQKLPSPSPQMLARQIQYLSHWQWHIVHGRIKSDLMVVRRTLCPTLWFYLIVVQTKWRTCGLTLGLSNETLQLSDLLVVLHLMVVCYSCI